MKNNNNVKERLIKKNDRKSNEGQMPIFPQDSILQMNELPRTRTQATIPSAQQLIKKNTNIELQLFDIITRYDMSALENFVNLHRSMFLSIRDPNGRNALHYSAFFDDDDAVQILIEMVYLLGEKAISRKF